MHYLQLAATRIVTRSSVYVGCQLKRKGGLTFRAFTVGYRWFAALSF